MIGLICNDELNLVGHLLFNNFRLALYNYYNNIPFKDIKNSEDLNEIKYLFIVDEHFVPNKNIWMNKSFIDTVNNKNISVFIFNFEKIFNSAFPWNVDIQKALNCFKNVFQLNADIDDINFLHKKFINKQYLSKNTNFNISVNNNKLNKILFIGRSEGPEYRNRKMLLEKIKQMNLELDIFETGRKLSYNEFLNKINEYKYILNPLGTGKFINLRHFEALQVGTIPIQQITEDMLPWYKEDEKNCIYFTQPEQISEKLNENKKITKIIYLEEYFDIIHLKDLI